MLQTVLTVLGLFLVVVMSSCSDMYDSETILDPSNSPIDKGVRPYLGRYEGQWIVNRQSAEKANAVIDTLLKVSQLPQKEILSAILDDRALAEATAHTVYHSCQIHYEFVGFSESSAYFCFQPQPLVFNTSFGGHTYVVRLYFDIEASAMVYNQSRENMTATFKINKVKTMAAQRSTILTILIWSSHSVAINIKRRPLWTRSSRFWLKYYKETGKRWLRSTISMLAMPLLSHIVTCRRLPMQGMCFKRVFLRYSPIFGISITRERGL